MMDVDGAIFGVPSRELRVSQLCQGNILMTPEDAGSGALDWVQFDKNVGRHNGPQFPSLESTRPQTEILRQAEPLLVPVVSNRSLACTQSTWHMMNCEKEWPESSLFIYLII